MSNARRHVLGLVYYQPCRLCINSLILLCGVPSTWLEIPVHPSYLNICRCMKYRCMSTSCWDGVGVLQNLFDSVMVVLVQEGAKHLNLMLAARWNCPA